MNVCVVVFVWLSLDWIYTDPFWSYVVVPQFAI